MVQQAEVDRRAGTPGEIGHVELAVVAVAQDAHLLVQHGALLLASVGLEVLVGLGVGVAADEARWKESQRRRRRRRRG